MIRRSVQVLLLVVGAGLAAFIVMLLLASEVACPLFHMEGRDHGLLNQNWYPRPPYRDWHGNVMYFDLPRNMVAIVQTKAKIDGLIGRTRADTRKATLLEGTSWEVVVERAENTLVIVREDGKRLELPLSEGAAEAWYTSELFRAPTFEAATSLNDALERTFHGDELAKLRAFLLARRTGAATRPAHD